MPLKLEAKLLEVPEGVGENLISSIIKNSATNSNIKCMVCNGGHGSDNCRKYEGHSDRIKHTEELRQCCKCTYYITKDCQVKLNRIAFMSYT